MRERERECVCGCVCVCDGPGGDGPAPAAAAVPAVLRTPTKVEKFQEDDDDGDDYAASSGLGSLVKRQPDHVSPVKAVAKIEEQAMVYICRYICR